MTTVQDQTTPAAPSAYPELFKRYIMRSARAALTRLAQETVGLSEEGRERALHVLPFALELAPAWPTARDLLLHLAPKMEMAGYRDEWLPYLQQGLVCSRQANDALAAAEVQLHIGQLYRLQSQFEPARHALEASAAEFGALGKMEGQARVWNELAYLAWHQRRYTEAQHLAQTALTCLDENTSERATSLSVLGLVAISLRQWREGENYFEESLQIRKVHGDLRRVAWTMQHLGYILHSQGNFAEAISYYEAAIQILTEIHDLFNCAITQMSLGIVYWLTEQPARALALYDMAEVYFRKSQDFLHLAKLSTNQGLGHLTLGAWQKAIQRFKDSAALYQTLSDQEGYLNALDGLGLAYDGLGAYDEAIAVFEAALDQLPLLKDDPNAELMRQELTANLQATQTKKGRS